MYFVNVYNGEEIRFDSELTVTDDLSSIANTLGEFLAEQLKLKQLSNRALAAGAGISESVIRNMLQHGISRDAKEPDPKTLRTVADYLGINAIFLFRLAGYIPPEPDGNSVAADFLADMFDRLPAMKQAVVLSVFESLIEDDFDKLHLEAMQEDTEGFRPAPFISDFPASLRIAANNLILNSSIRDPKEMIEANIPAETEVLPGTKWSTLIKMDRQRVLALARAKLNLEYDPTMVDPEWRG
jgi:transcriptional regulator with XRE-family HTH domain